MGLGGAFVERALDSPISNYASEEDPEHVRKFIRIDFTMHPDLLEMATEIPEAAALQSGDVILAYHPADVSDVVAGWVTEVSETGSKGRKVAWAVMELF